MHGFEDGGSIIGDVDVFALGSRSNGYEYFVHASGSEGGFDEVGDGDGSDKGGLG